MTGPLEWLLAVYGRMLPREVRDDVLADVREEHRGARARGVSRARAGFRMTRHVVSTNFIGLHRTARRVRARAARAGPNPWASFPTQRSPVTARDSSLLARGVWHFKLRHAIATLKRSPGFSALAVGTIAISLGGVAVVTGTLHTVLLEPLPYLEPDRLVLLWHTDVERDEARLNTSEPQFVEWRASASSFSAMAAYRGPGWTVVTGGPQPERVPSVRVTPNLFELLGVSPAQGRAFTSDDASPDAARSVIVSYQLWDRLGRPVDAIGSVISLDEQPYAIVGVMPPGFWFVEHGIDVWFPHDPANSGSWDQWTLKVVARLGAGVSREAAGEMLSQQHAALIAAQPGLDVPSGVAVRPLLDEIVGDVRGGLVATGGAVLVALLIAIVNVGGLLLARNLGRTSEFTVMRALGASRRGILVHITAQACVLAAAGMVLSVPVAMGLLAIARRELPADLPRMDQLSIGAVGWATAAVAAFVMAIGSGVLGIPWRRNSLQPLLRRSHRRARLLGGILVAQTALAVVLLVAGGLLLRSFLGLRSIDPGIEPDGVVAFDLRLPPSLADDEARIRQWTAQLDESVASIPGVAAVGQIQRLPFAGGNWNSGVVDPRNPNAPQQLESDVRVITPGYLSAIGLPLLSGRAFDETDRAASMKVALVNERLAQRLWPGADPIGQRLIIGMFDDWDAEVVGVVGPVHHNGLAAEVQPELYVPYAQAPVMFSTLVMRGAISAELITRVRQEVHQVGPMATVSPASLMTDLVGRSIAIPRMHTFVFGALGVLGLLLAAVGIYGVASFGVTQTRNEIGLRAALGATSNALQLEVLGRTSRLVMVGLAVGLAASVVLLRSLATLLYVFTPGDPTTYFGVALTLMAVALAAAYVPARKAAGVDPMVAMRSL